MSKELPTTNNIWRDKPTLPKDIQPQRFKGTIPSQIRQSATRNLRLEAGFTLLEILIAILIFATIVTTIFASYRTVFSDTDIINKDQGYYEMAKGCIDRMVIDIQSIYLTQPPVYTVPDLDVPPEPYRIVSDTDAIKGVNFPRLRFTSLAHLPFGKNQQDGIAEIVYYVQATDDDKFALKRSDSLDPAVTFRAKASDPTLCEDLKTLEYEFYDQEGNEYKTWDSDLKEFGYASPRSINIKLELDTGSNTSVLFETRVTLPVQRKKIK